MQAQFGTHKYISQSYKCEFMSADKYTELSKRVDLRILKHVYRFLQSGIMS